MKTILSTKVDKKVLQAVKNFAYCKGMKMQAIIEQALITLLEKEGRYESNSRKR